MTLLVTTCTLRKRVVPSPRLRARDLQLGAIEGVSREWSERVAAAVPAAQAWRLYCGRGFQEALQAARSIGSLPAIVSAGLGILDGEQSIPAYSLTVVSGSPDDVTAKSHPCASPETWWRHLERFTD